MTWKKGRINVVYMHHTVRQLEKTRVIWNPWSAVNQKGMEGEGGQVFWNVHHIYITSHSANATYKTKVAIAFSASGVKY